MMQLLVVFGWCMIIWISTPNWCFGFEWHFWVFGFSDSFEFLVQTFGFWVQIFEFLGIWTFELLGFWCNFVVSVKSLIVKVSKNVESHTFTNILVLIVIDVSADIKSYYVCFQVIFSTFTTVLPTGFFNLEPRMVQWSFCMCKFCNLKLVKPWYSSFWLMYRYLNIYFKVVLWFWMTLLSFWVFGEKKYLSQLFLVKLLGFGEKWDCVEV